MNKSNFETGHVLVEKLLKKNAIEKTEIVYLSLENGSRQGPYIRKTFDKNSGLGNAYVQIFKKSDITNENIPKIYWVDDNNSSLIIFEEFVEGATLDTYSQYHDLNSEILFSIFSQLCNALIYLHTEFDSPIIHRDIKPSNILITESGQVKLIDFGISRNFDDNLSKDTHKFGTVGYAPPEQFGYKQTDVRSDVYSLGKVLEFLCDEKNWESCNSKIQNFNDIIQKAIEFDPNKRYKSVRHLLNVFSKVQHLEKNTLANIVGHIWNVLLLAACVFLIFMTFFTITDPNNVNFSISIVEKILFTFMMIFFFFIPIFIVFSYKPSIRQIFPKLPRFKPVHYVIFILVCIAGITIIAMLAQILR